MIACEDSKCKYEWFHFTCVGIDGKNTPGDWFCPECVEYKNKFNNSAKNTFVTSHFAILLILYNMILRAVLSVYTCNILVVDVPQNFGYAVQTSVQILMTSFGFHFPNVLMLTQVSITAAILESLRIAGVLNIPKYSLERGRKFLIPSMCFALQTTMALKALSILSIPMYNVLRRLLPLVTLLFGRLIFHKFPSNLVVISILMVVSGCFIAGLGDLQFSLDAYVCAMASVLSQAFYLIYVQKTGVDDGLSTVAVLHLNSINCIPILVIYVVMTREINVSLHYTGLQSSGFEVVLIIDILMGCLLNYSLFLCATWNSALTTSLVGVIKGVLTTIIGFFTFGGVPATFLIVTGICLNSLGGILYSYGKYLETVQKQINKHSHMKSVEVSPSELNKNNGIHIGNVKELNANRYSTEHSIEEKPTTLVV